MSSLSFSPAGSDAQPDVVVLEEDQKKINRFARLNLRGEDLEERLKDLKRQLDNVEEASNELMLADDDDLEDLEEGGDQPKGLSSVHYRFGDAFLSVGKDEAEAMLEREKKTLQARAVEVEERLAPIKEEMASIKATLYAKFGSNINLDNDDE